MKSLAMLIGTFLITFGMLSVMWLTMTGNPDAKAAASPSSSPTAAPTSSIVAAGSPVPTHGRARSSASTPASLAISPSTTPLFTAVPDSMPPASSSPVRTHTVSGADYVTSQVPGGGTVEAAGQGVVVQAPRTGTLATSVTYQLDSAQLPVDALVLHVDVVVCGEVSGGSSYEVDGPSGVAQTVLTSVPPQSDGCWHLPSEAPSDLSVTVKATDGSRIAITSVTYLVTTDR